MFGLKLSNLWRRLYQFLYNRVIVILVSLLCLGLCVGSIGSYYLSINLVDSQALQYARVAVKTLNEARKLYSNNVVGRLESINGVTVGAQYHEIQGGIPNPATYTIELAENLSDESSGVLFRLYSDYPFPNRKATGGPQDQFGQDALTYLKKHSDVPFYRKEIFRDRLTFRYAEAIMMEPSCVDCHNTLSYSPKRDWKVGQVGGIVEITQPLDAIMLIAQSGLKTIYTVLATITGLAIAGLVLVIGRFRMVNRELEKKVAERTAALNRLATLDGLTQLANRRQFDQVLEQEWRRLQRRHQPLSLLLCDVDYFKNYNDTYGHQAGDDCLRAIAQVLQSSVKRPGEFAARYGGEEFAIVLPDANRLEATQVGDLIRTAMHRLKIPHATSGNHSHVTLSIGIAINIPNANDCPQQLIKAADDALYQAKNQGRDRYVVWSEPSS